MEIKNTLKKIGLAALVAAGSILPARNSEAASGSIGYMASENTNGKAPSYGSYPELQMFYKTPLEINGFTFADFYKKDGYFAKTALDRSIKKGIGPIVQLRHINQPLTDEGFGINVEVPFLPKKAFAKGYYLPIWVDGQGKRESDRGIVGYFASIDLPFGINLSSFGEWNTKNGLFEYGEIELGKKFGNIGISYNPALQPNKSGIPSFENRVTTRIYFGGSK